MYIAQTNSTNTLMKKLLAEGKWPDSERFLRTDYQTAGRGQAGNGWESEQGKNLLFSGLLNTAHTPVENQFDLSVVTSVALHKFVGSISRASRDHLESISSRKIPEPTIKWPNDLYWEDKKLAGILIETGLSQNRIAWAIAGIGLNVNQTEFVSNAPNPVSLKQIYGTDFDLAQLMELFLTSLSEVETLSREEQWAYYLAHLYRREGYWPFVEREVSTMPTMNADQAAQGQFLACIREIFPNGEILLETKDGNRKSYHFKQIRYVL